MCIECESCPGGCSLSTGMRVSRSIILCEMRICREEIFLRSFPLLAQCNMHVCLRLVRGIVGFFRLEHGGDL